MVDTWSCCGEGARFWFLWGWGGTVSDIAGIGRDGDNVCGDGVGTGKVYAGYCGDGKNLVGMGWGWGTS